LVELAGTVSSQDEKKMNGCTRILNRAPSLTETQTKKLLQFLRMTLRIIKNFLMSNQLKRQNIYVQFNKFMIIKGHRDYFIS